jgi:uncharacterized repeat protein (TIGR01451 family)
VASSTSGTQGQTISYTVTLVNLGPSARRCNVTLTDLLSAGPEPDQHPSGNNGTASISSSNATGATATGQLGQWAATLTLVLNATVTASSRQHHQHGSGHQHHT